MPSSQYYEAAQQTVFVIGHRNPDTDSICSAIAYAWLKNRLSERDAASGKGEGLSYIPMRAGHVNQETAFVLNYFHIPDPDYITNVEPQVKDIAIKQVEGIVENISL